MEVVAIAKTRTSSEVKNRWKQANYTRIVVEVPKDTGTKFKEKCKRENIPQAQVLKEAINNFLGDE